MMPTMHPRATPVSPVRPARAATARAFASKKVATITT
jgi:hypothetical protein